MTARRKQTITVIASTVALVLAVAGTLYLRRAPADAERRGVAATAPAPAASGDPSADPSAPVPSAAPSSAPTPSGSAAAASRRATPTATAAGNLATGLRRLPAATRQVIIVHGDGFAATHATFEAFTKTNNGWQPAFGTMAARVGTRGFADAKVEGDLKTPTGMYSFGATMYGIAAAPGVRYRYHRLGPDDWWNENPATTGYNTFQHGPDPGGASEALWQIAPQYNHFAVINYNTPVVAADPPRGSGIFLHVMVPGRATAGCVALAEADLLRVLRWLDPAASPRIVMAPRSALGRY